MSLVRRTRLSPGRGLRTAWHRKPRANAQSAIRLWNTGSFGLRPTPAHLLSINACLKTMHNIASPINPCAEPNWTLGSFRQNARTRRARVRFAKILSAGRSWCSSSLPLSQAPPFRGSVRPAALGDLPPTEGGEAPTGAGADRRTRWLALRQSLSLQRKGTAGP